MENVFRNKDSVLKYVLIGVKSIVFGIVITIALSMLFGCRFLKIVTDSMAPNYNKGDVIMINTKFNYDDLKIGDVITYKAGSANVTHRVVDKTSDGLVITQGDANGTVDYSTGIKKENFVGKVVFSIPKLGNFLEKLSKPQNYIIIVIGIVVLLFISIM